MKNILLFLISLFLSFQIAILAQQPIDSIQEIQEVIIKGQRIAIPFQKKSNTISILTSDLIKASTATTTDELLQMVPGVDVRTRGVEGMQSDVYIRGGNFNQILLLIDGIKMDDLQSGHHTMNALIAIDNIERIEIIKGAAARIYGQNAMNGAINIVSKKALKDQTKIEIKVGSFSNLGMSIAYQKQLQDGGIQLYVSKNQSEGYRYNTDFDNFQTFFQTNWKNHQIIASFSKKKFGANGFYASPKYKDQYEETQTSLVAFKSVFKVFDLEFKPNFYWRQNQDMYLFLRDNPDFYRNFHRNNKIGVSVNTSVSTRFGVTGIGVDVNMGLLESNNLGDRNRLSSSLFIEQRFELLNKKLDITPGINLSNYSDFGFFFYPGINFGYQLNNQIKLYANIGLTHRLPTYTNLYYQSLVEEGNSTLKPEKALTYESGIKYHTNKLFINTVFFKRNAKDLIDWVKTNEDDKWKAQNIGKTITQGFEIETNYRFKIKNFPQRMGVSYTFMDDHILDLEIPFSRYAINSFKHQLTSFVQTQFFSYLKESVSYRYVVREEGENYHLVDIALMTQYKRLKLSIKANNVFDEIYTETNLVPMPRFNFMMAVSYSF